MSVIALGIAGVVLGSFGFRIGATFVVLFLVLHVYSNLKSKIDNLTAVGAMLAAAVIFASFLYIFGQVAQPLSHFVIRILFFGCLVTVCLIGNHYRLKSRIIGNLLTAVALSGLLSFWYSTATARLLTFLGFGYDNYGHLYIFRRVLINRQSYIGLSRPDDFVTFVGASPFGTHSLLALIAEAIGVKGTEVHQSVSFFALVAFVMPLATICLVFLSMRHLNIPKRWNAIGTALFGTVILFGYPSHIWFSGYLTSNFSTLLMLLGVCIAVFCDSSTAKLFVLAALGVAQFLVYPLYAIFAAVPFAVAIFVGRGDDLKHVFEVVKRYPGEFLFLSGVCAGLILFCLRGLMSVHGVSQFLAPGGIAPLPIGTTMFVFGISMAFAIKASNQEPYRRATSLIPFGLVSLAVVGIAYSYLVTVEPGQFWTVSYYPTKLAISVLIVCLAILIIRTTCMIAVVGQSIGDSILESVVIVAASAALVIATFNSWPFSGGYMGTTQGVIGSLRSGTEEVVDGQAVLKALGHVQDSKNGALYLSDVHESELNTRWINSLNLNWTDTNWEAWRRAREAIDAGNFSEASSALQGNFVLFFDDYSRLTNDMAAFSVFQERCIISLGAVLQCR